eukprot:Skav202078  [mRNA]  locus=scaffold1138:878767:887738:- [translate_table: standard]
MKREDSKPAAKPAPPREDRGQVTDVANTDGFIPLDLVEDEMQGLYFMAKEAPGPVAAISDSCLPILQAEPGGRSGAVELQKLLPRQHSSRSKSHSTS